MTGANLADIIANSEISPVNFFGTPFIVDAVNQYR